MSVAPETERELTPEVTPEAAAQAQRTERIERLTAMIQSDPALNARALAEVHVMLNELHDIFGNMYRQFQTNGGGLGGVMKMLRGG